MLMRIWQAALLAALASLMGNVVWAQEPIAGQPKGAFATGYAPPAVSLPYPLVAIQSKCGETADCCKDDKCCKDGDCCKEGKCCKENKCVCGKGGECCCKENKCDCAKGGECCCKKGECKCKKSSCCCQGMCGECCPFLAKLAKSARIVVVMPSLLGACHPETALMPVHPAQIVLPCPPPAPMLAPPGMPVMPPQVVGVPMPPPPAGCPCPAPAPCLVSAPMKANPSQENCAMILHLAGELCSVVRPLNTSSVCATALGLLTEMCAQSAYNTTPQCLGYATPPTQWAQAPMPTPDAPYYCPSRELNALPPAPPRPGSPYGSPYGCPPQSNAYLGGGETYSGGGCSAPPMPTVVPCCTTASANADKLRVVAKSDSDQLEMKVGDACLSCKKMTVKLGESEITLRRFDDRVRVRGEELKATADSVRSDRKDHLILEGDVVLHYKKDGHSANVSAERIDLNLTSGTMTIKAAKTLQAPAVRINGVDTESR